MTNFNNQDQQTIMQKLQAPFPMSDIEFRIGSTNQDKTQGMALAYLTNRAIQNRFDEIFGPFGWKNEYKDWKGKGVLCGISVLWNGEWITKWDGADETEFEPTKGGLSDSMKRAAVQWGCGRIYYQLEAQWVPIKQIGNGKSYKILQKPTLPAWALPGGEQQNSPAQAPQHSHAPAPQPVQQPVPTNVISFEEKKNNTQQLSEEEELCACCGKEKVSGKVLDYSKRKFGAPTCFKCQELKRGHKEVSGNPNPTPAQAPQHHEAPDYATPFDDGNDEIPF